MPNEIWKQAVGWPDYAVSSWGRIFSFKRGSCTHKSPSRVRFRANRTLEATWP
jgi:NUMOD4 motif